MTKKARTTTVSLEFPVTYEDLEVSELTVRRMRAGDALAGEGTTDDAEAGYLLLARLCDVDVELIKLLDLEDFMTLQGVMMGMLGKHGKKALEETQAKLSAGVS